MIVLNPYGNYIANAFNEGFKRNYDDSYNRAYKTALIKSLLGNLDIPDYYETVEPQQQIQPQQDQTQQIQQVQQNQQQAKDTLSFLESLLPMPKVGIPSKDSLLTFGKSNLQDRLGRYLDKAVISDLNQQATAPIPQPQTITQQPTTQLQSLLQSLAPQKTLKDYGKWYNELLNKNWDKITNMITLGIDPTPFISNATKLYDQYVAGEQTLRNTMFSKGLDMAIKQQEAQEKYKQALQTIQPMALYVKTLFNNYGKDITDEDAGMYALGMALGVLKPDDIEKAVKEDYKVNVAQGKDGNIYAIITGNDGQSVVKTIQINLNQLAKIKEIEESIDAKYDIKKEKVKQALEGQKGNEKNLAPKFVQWRVDPDFAKNEGLISEQYARFLKYNARPYVTTAIYDPNNKTVSFFIPNDKKDANGNLIGRNFKTYPIDKITGGPIETQSTQTNSQGGNTKSDKSKTTKDLIENLRF